MNANSRFPRHATCGVEFNLEKEVIAADVACGEPGLAVFGNAAYDMILGDGAKVFDLAQEGEPMRDWYGRNRFGQSCLTARRLIERGVKYVTINHGGWDTHKQNFQAMRQKVPDLDRGLATLLQDLARLGMLESTIIFAAANSCWHCDGLTMQPALNQAISGLAMKPVRLLRLQALQDGSERRWPACRRCDKDHRRRFFLRGFSGNRRST